MNINEEIQKTTDKIIAEKLPAMIEKKVESMLDGVLEDLFRSYGDLAKDVKSKISENLNVSLEKLNLTDYNALVAQQIGKLLKDQTDLKPIEDIVRSIVGRSERTKIDLPTLEEEIRALAIEDSYNEMEGEFTLHIEEDVEHKWWRISADLEADVNPKECAVQVIVSKDRMTMFHMTTNNFYYKDKQLSPTDAVGISGLENLFFSLYNNQVEFIIDEDYDYRDTSWSKYD